MPPPRPNALALAALTLGLIAAAYLAHLPGPLRLNNDAESYLVLARSAIGGQGFTWYGEPTHFPSGYPAVVALLDDRGYANAAALILLNLVAIAAGLAAWYRLQRESFDLGRIPAIAPVVAVLLAWPMIKHAILPVSESLYIGYSFGALLLLHHAHTGPSAVRVTRFLAAIALIAAAIQTRTVGVALLPALALACLPAGLWSRLRAHRRACGIAAAGAGVLALIAAALLVRYTRYGHEMLDQFRQTAFLTQASDKLLDLGEVALNLPHTKVPFLIPFLMLAGFLLLLAVARGTVRRRTLAPHDAYFLTYATIMLLWPYHDPRFWVPVLPLLFTYAAFGIARALAHPAGRAIAILYATGFIATGIAALTVSLSLAFAGTAFPERYAAGALRGTYRAACNIPLANDDVATLNPNIVSLLRHYDPRSASPNPPPNHH